MLGYFRYVPHRSGRRWPGAKFGTGPSAKTSLITYYYITTIEQTMLKRGLGVGNSLVSLLLEGSFPHDDNALYMP